MTRLELGAGGRHVAGFAQTPRWEGPLPPNRPPLQRVLAVVRARARARPALTPQWACRPPPQLAFPFPWARDPAQEDTPLASALPGPQERERAPGRACILRRGGAGAGQRGRGGLAPARAGMHRGGRRDCEVALTHVPGFLSREGGGGGGARAGLGRRRWPPRGAVGLKSVPLAQSRCPSLTNSPSFHHGRAAPDPAAS